MDETIPVPIQWQKETKLYVELEVPTIGYLIASHTYPQHSNQQLSLLSTKWQAWGPPIYAKYL